jgi:uncharacterized DUF497 family protein
MKIDFDQNKSNKNFDERGLAFDVVVEFEWESAVIQEDLRKAYPERRFVAAGKINYRLHIICFTPILEGIRVISLRKANKREVISYEAAINQ